MATLTVLQSIAFREAFLELTRQFDRATGHHTVPLFDGGIRVMERVKAGETVDLVIMAADKIDELITAGRLVAGSRTDLGISPIGVAVRDGAAKPDIGSGEAVKRALLAARTIAYSTGPSGVHLESLIEGWGIADALAGRLVQVRGEPAGAPVARGEADLGFQQVAELLPVAGIEIVGTLPPDIQKMTTFSVGLHRAAPDAATATALMRFLGSPAAAPVIRVKGMEPLCG
ncbi:MAG: substrate-binding domain-containing protein [Proteobacteria bacterium]|nr:substrate-binding domain-containing protein [Burkholderiales bacterium]